MERGWPCSFLHSVKEGVASAVGLSDECQGLHAQSALNYVGANITIDVIKNKHSLYLPKFEKTKCFLKKELWIDHSSFKKK